MINIRTTQYWRRYWKKRKLNWEAEHKAEHPHRDLLVRTLRNFEFGSLVEIGCGSGVNLAKIQRAFPGVSIGGVDINEDAIEMAKKMMPEASVLEVSDATKVFLSDNSVDLALTDMTLIYMNRFNIGKALKEIKRIARKSVVICEFHSERRFKMNMFRRYNVYNYKKLLKKHGFWDIGVYKLSENDWPGGEPQKTFGYIILAKIK